MHDFLIAKEIFDEVEKISKEKKLKNIKRVDLEVGVVALAHDGLPEHEEDVSVENLQFGLESVSKGTSLDGIEFSIKKTNDNNWKITNIVVE
jgi:Zn finger protein HypA/HybF involved in hydrogenase expression